MSGDAIAKQASMSKSDSESKLETTLGVNYQAKHHPLGSKKQNLFHYGSKLFLSYSCDANNRGEVLMTLKFQLLLSNNNEIISAVLSCFIFPTGA